MKKCCYSIRIPFVAIMHFQGIKLMGFSRKGCFGWLVHYDRKMQLIGRSERNIVGEWVHYNTPNCCVGFTRNGGDFVMKHYSQKCKRVGKSVCILYLIIIHSTIT